MSSQHASSRADSSRAAQRTSLPEQVIIWETAEAFFVGWANAEEDWLARFDKAEEFPARAWAERMADLCNGRAAGHTLDPVGPVTSHAPR